MGNGSQTKVARDISLAVVTIVITVALKNSDY